MRASRRIAAVGVALSIAGCPLPDPCPTGRARHGDRCVVPDAGHEGEDSSAEGADTPPPEHPRTDDAQDAAMDADEPVNPAPDGAADETDASEVAAGDADAPQASCSTSDLGLWHDFQRSGRLALSLNDCYVEYSACSGPGCSVAACLHRAVEVLGCQPCIANQIVCTSNNCRTECTAPDAYDSCRKCFCANDCTNAALGCASAALDVCADCMGGKCENVSVDPSVALHTFNFTTILAPSL
jgi:hypothetical protein